MPELNRMLISLRTACLDDFDFAFEVKRDAMADNYYGRRSNRHSLDRLEAIPLTIW